MIRSTRGVFAPLVALLVALAACGTDVGGGSTEIEGTEGPLSGVCPDPVVIQTDWFPEAEYGATYELIGDDYSVDVENRLVSGRLVAQGNDTGVEVEVRTGGPAINAGSVPAEMYVDEDITLGFVNTARSVISVDDVPTLAVVAPLEKNPQIIMWDPATYPEVETIADLGEEGVIVSVSPGATYAQVLVSLGVLFEDQIDPSYTGSPAIFISEGGAIAQQGFASAEPYYYESVYDEWMKPIAFELIYDAGFREYSQAISIRADDLEPLRDCLELLVPIYQQAAIDYIADPADTNALIVDVVAQFDDFWVYDEGVAEFSARTQKELALVGDGPDDTLGNFDPVRVQEVIDQMRAAGMDVMDGLEAEDIVTNEFIDPSIGLG